MVSLPLLQLADEAAYRAHFEATFCKAEITTHDGIRVFFSKDDFDHAFFESSGRRGEKDIFSNVRAERMEWILEALQDTKAFCCQGWVSKIRAYDPTRRVTIVRGDFVVVIGLGRKKDGTIKAKFMTCYKADNSINKILQSPQWTIKDAMNVL